MAELKVPLTKRDHVQGDAQAAITLVEYGDYECPHCGHAYPIVQKIQKHLGSRLRFVFRNFPLTEIHPYAEAAAEAAEFAAAHAKFWEMHDAIFANQQNLRPALLLQLVQDLGLSADGLRDALATKTYAAHVREDFMGGVRSGVNGTPTFFINGYRHDGPFEYEDLLAALESA